MNTVTHDAAIGIFDSGLGGLTVASAIASALPGENLIYLGDTARVPYGTRSPQTVVKYARRNVAFLRNRGVKAVVVACNTVSAQGLDELSNDDGVLCVGVIEPGARAAIEASSGAGIAVLGTPATIASNAYPSAIATLDAYRLVVQIPCPLFVPLVEEGWLTHSVTYEVVREYLKTLAGQDIDTIILGCTHYPLLAPAIRSVAQEVLKREVRIVDSAISVARSVETLLTDSGLMRSSTQGTHRFFVTDAPQRVADVANSFWEHSDGRLVLEHIDLVDHDG